MANKVAKRGRSAARRSNLDRRVGTAVRTKAWPTWLFVALLVFTGLAVYGNSLWGVFIFDDQTAILANPNLRQLWPLRSAMAAPPDTAVAGRPIVSLSLAFNYALGGMDGRGFHAFNVAVHILCALVLFGIVRRTLVRQPLGDRFGALSSHLAAACALIWMVHPLQTEVVNYITQRTESMMALFYFLTLYAAIRAADADRAWGWSLCSIAACALGMASKETIVAAPLLVVLYDAIFRTEPFRRVIRRRWGLYAGLASTWLVIGVLASSGPRSATAGFALGFSPLTYGLNQCLMVARYLRLAIWPTGLVLDYGLPQPVTAIAVAPAGLLVLCLLATTLVLLRYRAPLGYLGAWFVLTLAPTSSILPIASEVGAERRMYVPLAALSVLFVIGGLIAFERAGRSRAAAGMRRWLPAFAVLCLVAGLGAASARRNLDYRSAARIWQTVVERRPHWRAFNNLGAAMGDAGLYAEAARHYTQAVRLNPASSLLQSNLAHALEMTGALDEALLHYQESLKLDPGNANIRNLMGIALVKQNRMDEATTVYQDALRLQPGLPDVRANLADALAMQQRFEEAAIQYREVLKTEPDNAVILNSLGMALASAGDVESALEQYRRAVEVRPDYAEARFNLGLALMMTGNSAEGETHLEEATRLDPSMRGAADDVRLKLSEAPPARPSPSR